MKPLPPDTLGDAMYGLRDALGLTVSEPQALPAAAADFAALLTTIDEASASADVTAQVMRPWPDWGYLRYVVNTVATERYLRVDKSGQVLVSWGCIAAKLHAALTRRGYRLAYYCRTATQAESHIKNRFERLYQSIPSQYERPHAEVIGGVFTVFADGRDRPATGWIVPMASEQAVVSEAASKMRSETWSDVLLDESAFYKNLDELVGSLMARTHGMTAVSTPNGQEHFHRLGFGDMHDEKATPAQAGEVTDAGEWFDMGSVKAEQVMRGVWRWHRNGFEHLRVHFTARPDRTADWAKDALTRTDTRLWRREQAISYDVEAGLPVFCDTDKIVIKPQFYAPNLPLIRGHDYSFKASACLTCQIRPWTDTGASAPFKLHFLREFISIDSHIEPHKKGFLDDCAKTFVDMTDYRDYGDYSANQRTSTGAIIEEYRKPPSVWLITVPTGPGGVLKGISILQHLISVGAVEIEPTCPMLIKALRSSYVRDDHGEPSTDHPWADLADAARYIVINLVELVPLPSGGNTVKFKGDFRSRQSTLQQRESLPSRQEPGGAVRPDGYRGARRV